MNFRVLSLWLVQGITACMVVVPFFVYFELALLPNDFGLPFLFFLLALVLNWVPFFCFLWIIRSILVRYRAGLVFDRKYGNLFRWLGLVLLGEGLIFKVFARAFFRLAETLSLGNGNRVLEITFDQISLGIAFCGVLVLLLSFVMGEAARLYDEQSFTV